MPVRASSARRIYAAEELIWQAARLPYNSYSFSASRTTA